MAERPPQRYEIEQHTKDAWQVIDRDAKKYEMPRKAVSLNLTKGAATEIARILNHEWIMFTQNPK